MSTFFRYALFSVLLTACGGGLDPYSERTSLLDPADAANAPVDDGEDRNDEGEQAPADEANDEAPPPVETCTTGNGQAGAIDCAGDCMPTAFIGDGYCDSGTGGGADFSCATHGFDDGDCDPNDTPEAPVPDPTAPATPAPAPSPVPPSPAPSTCTTASGAPGVLDCDGTCHPDAFIGDGYCDDGSTDANFQCAQYNDDGGDCDTAPTVPVPTVPAPTTPDPTTPAPTTPTPQGPLTGDFCITTDGFLGVIDCAGTCSPSNWVGDGVCDDGTDEADFMCFEFLFDIGDCLP